MCKSRSTDLTAFRPPTNSRSVRPRVQSGDNQSRSHPNWHSLHERFEIIHIPLKLSQGKDQVIQKSVGLSHISRTLSSRVIAATK